MFQLFSKPDTGHILDALMQAVPHALGDNLLSLTVYGVHVTSTSRVKDRSPIHVLIVLREVDRESLTRLANELHRQRVTSRLTPILLSYEELMSSTDVFPITFLDMKRHYRVLAGRDVLAELSIGNAHLRLRCEQELKNLAIRMQSAFLRQSRRPQQLLEALRHNYAAFTRASRACLILVGETAPAEDCEIASATARRFELPAHVLQRVADAIAGDGQVGNDALVDLFAAFLVAVHQTAEAIDNLPHDVAVLEEADQ